MKKTKKTKEETRAATAGDGLSVEESRKLELTKKAEAEEEHRAWIKEKNRTLRRKEKERKEKEEKIWDDMKKEREALIERKRKEVRGE